MEMVNLYAGWIGILVGFATGTLQGLGFHREDFMGGYASWRRRMTRLGHISCFGLGFVNLAYAFTVRSLGLASISPWPSTLFIVGAITMPLTCYLSAFRQPWRHLFFLPVISLLAGAAIFIWADLLP